MKRASRRIRNDRVVVCSAVIIEKLVVWRGIRGCSHSSNECNIADTREEAEGIEGINRTRFQTIPRDALLRTSVSFKKRKGKKERREKNE